MKISCLFLIFLSVHAFPQDRSSFIDTRDGCVYETITLGSQTWMAENLAWELSGSWCYADSSANGDVYGRLYTWEQATRSCPDGWRLPGDDDWKVLERHMGMTAEEADIFLYRGKYAYRRAIYHDKEGIDRDAATLTLGFSVRCIKN